MKRLATIAIALAIASGAAAQVSPDTTFVRFHNVQIHFTNARVTTCSTGSMMGNVACVAPGATITVEADYVMAFSADPADYSYCPSCAVQSYVAWLPEAAAAGASPVNLGLWSGVSYAPGMIFTSEGATAGHFVFTTTAPTTPGEYYIGVGETLDYSFQPGATGAAGFDDHIGLTGEPVFTAFLISVVSAPPAACPGDSNGDGVVDFNDIVTSLSHWLNVCF